MRRRSQSCRAAAGAAEQTLEIPGCAQRKDNRRSRRIRRGRAIERLIMQSTSSSPALVSERNSFVDLLVITLLWCIGIAVVNPLGDFPLNDDWAFGLTVKHLVETGEYRPIGWFPMPFITNALWGSLFCIPFGFSFTALRISTLTLAWAGTLGSYLLIRELGQPRWLGLIVALIVGFNPIYFALSNTFMTDVPCAALMIFSGLFFVRTLKNGSTRDFVVGSILAVAATMSRQLALCIPLAFAVSWLLSRGFCLKNILRVVTLTAVAIGALYLFQQWLEASGREPPRIIIRIWGLFNLLSRPKTQGPHVIINTHVGLLYLGLFLLPVLTVVMPAALRFAKKQQLALLALAAGILGVGSVIMLRYGRDIFMPLSYNILVDSGIGPLTLRDTYILRLDHVPSLAAGFWQIVTALSLLGAALLIALIGMAALHLVRRCWVGRDKISKDDIAGLFLWLTGAIYSLALLLGGFYDRYLIPILPFFAAGVAYIYGSLPPSASKNFRVVRFFAVGTLVAICVFTIGTTRDYLAWNRLRWEGLRYLTEERRVPVRSIDGGFEFGGLYLSGAKRGPFDLTKSWWWVQDDTYQIAFGAVPGYKVIKEYIYRNWIPLRTGKVLVLQRNAEP